MLHRMVTRRVLFFFFNDTATTEIYTLSLHDALPILSRVTTDRLGGPELSHHEDAAQDRKSTRLNSSHGSISYAVFCLKKKKQSSLCLLSRIQRSHATWLTFCCASP